MAIPSDLDRASINEQQLDQLRKLLAAILRSNAFYTNKLAGIKTDFASLGEFSEQIPFTTKAELVNDQENNPKFGTNLTFPLERYTRFHQTSGTTGLPLRWLDTPESWSWMVESWSEVFRAAKVGAADKIYFAFSFGPFLGFWLAFDAAQRIGALSIPGGGLSSVSRLKAILDNDVTVLCCTPTYALHLAEVAAKENISLENSAVRKIMVAGEPGGSIPSTRSRLETLWPGAKVFDHHGMTEVGPVSYECPAQSGVLHVIESAYFPEILNPQTDQKTAPGETGELILTTLGRTGSPLLRYRTGDLVQAPETSTCLCGRNDLALRGGILGRVDDMIIVRGVNIHPSAVENVLRHIDGIAEYQALVKKTASLVELFLRIEPKSGLADAENLARRVGQELQLTFNLRVPVEVVALGTLPRFEMKAKRWISA